VKEVFILIAVVFAMALFLAWWRKKKGWDE
jgi:Mg2+ and Co2+ transporter CorA